MPAAGVSKRGIAVNSGVYTRRGERGFYMSCQPGCAVCEHLRDTALEIVGEGGIEALSESSLAQRAGFTMAEVSEHYPTAAGCLYDTYDEVVCKVLRGMVDAFAEGSDWQSGFELSRRRMLDWMSANPAEARLCFVETVRGDRELRRREDVTRRWVVEFLVSEHHRLGDGEELPIMQIEMLIGAGFHTISTAVAEGGAPELGDLEPKLAEVAGFFIPERV